MGPRLNGVIDASAQIDLLVGRISGADLAVFDGEFAAPEVFMVEVASGIRRLELRGVVSREMAERLFVELSHVPIELVPAREVVERAFELRHTISVADACYVALAEQRECALVTADRRLARAPGITVPFIVV